LYTREASLRQLAEQLRSGELDIITYINEANDWIEETEPIIQALIFEENRQQRLIREAEALLWKYPNPDDRPPLFGVLIGVKDLFNVDGFQTQAGSMLPPAEFEGAEASIITDLKNQGALILGKTVSTEFAYFQPGPTGNPLNPNHTPGGSSSGSAAAVAAGYCPLAFGTQTIASIIRPASYCGIAGFKPSFGRVSTQGVFSILSISRPYWVYGPIS
jgi:Asp-tRNA(Asn)/Glu-tRNA(Gln) amidotransferase A subunit family amidase